MKTSNKLMYIIVAILISLCFLIGLPLLLSSQCHAQATATTKITHYDAEKAKKYSHLDSLISSCIDTTIDYLLEIEFSFPTPDTTARITIKKIKIRHLAIPLTERDKYFTTKNIDQKSLAEEFCKHIQTILNKHSVLTRPLYKKER